MKSITNSAERAIYEVGERAMVQCIETGDVSALRRLAADANSAVTDVSTGGLKALGAATLLALRVFQRLGSSGLKFSAMPSEAEARYAASSNNRERIAHNLQRCVDMAGALRRVGRIKVRPLDGGTAYAASFWSGAK